MKAQGNTLSILVFGLALFLAASCKPPESFTAAKRSATKAQTVKKDVGPKPLNPNACSWGNTSSGQKIRAFLYATQELKEQVNDVANLARDACADIGAELGMSTQVLSGDTQSVCKAVAAAIDNHLEVSLKAGAKLTIKYKPAQCTVDIDAAARASAKCEGKAEADAGVRCEGKCEGTCSGRCDGRCRAKAKAKSGQGAKAKGECQGKCEGTCEGSCSGGCDGHAKVGGSAECRSAAEVKANVNAKCEAPKVSVRFRARAVLDTSKVEALKRGLERGLGRLLSIDAKINGPVKSAFTTWAATVRNLDDAAAELGKSFGQQAQCVTGQIRAAFRALSEIEVSMSVSVEASAEISGAAGGSAGAGS